MKVSAHIQTPPNARKQPQAVEKNTKSFASRLQNDGIEGHAKNFVNDVLKDEKRLNSTMKRAMRGAEMSQTQLLQTQALLYRYTQEVELASKVVDKTANGVKQLMSIQV